VSAASIPPPLAPRGAIASVAPRSPWRDIALIAATLLATVFAIGYQANEDPLTASAARLVSRGALVEPPALERARTQPPPREAHADNGHAQTPSVTSTARRGFDEALALRNIAEVASHAAESCAVQGAPAYARVAVLFAPSGRAEGAAVLGPFASTREGRCLRRALLTTTVPAFVGRVTQVTASARLR
jgi:hypothetical protein